MIILYFIFAMCLRETIANPQYMPVFLIDTEKLLPKTLKINTNPFHTMTSDSFSAIIHPVLAQCECVVIFIENGFSIEDISSKDVRGTPYYHVHRGFLDNKIRYIPNVEDPFDKLKQLMPPLESNELYLSNPTEDFDSQFKYYYIFFNDAGRTESKVEQLRRHDSIMRKAYHTIRHRSRGPVFGIYTGKRNPVMMRATEAPQSGRRYSFEPEPRDVMVVTEGALFRLTGVYSTSTKARVTQESPVVAEQLFTRRSLNTRMLYTDFELEFEFRMRERDWELKSVALLEGGENVGRTEVGASVPYGYSYYCAEPLVIYSRGGGAVVVSAYQVEALQLPLTDNVEPSENSTEAEGNSTVTTPPPAKTSFTDSVDCAPGFSAVILESLMLVGILLGITMYGILALYSCESNTRYDDVNQKPLLIVSET